MGRGHGECHWSVVSAGAFVKGNGVLSASCSLSWS